MSEAQQNRTLHPLPYKSHPIWPLRRLTLWSSTIGLILGVFSVQMPSLFLLLSVIFIVYDLMTWAIQKAKLSNNISRCANPSCPNQHHAQSASRADEGTEEPKWPRKFLIIADAILAIFLQILFWTTFSIISNHYYYYNGGTLLFGAYSILPLFFSSFLHGKAFWIELMARKKEEWLQSMPCKPCAACGYITPVAVPPDHHHHCNAHDNGPTLPHWAKSFNRKSRSRQDDLESGSSLDSEDSLLIAPTPGRSEENSPGGYGTLNQSVQSLTADGEKVSRKKKSKRVVGEDWVGTASASKSKGKGKAKVVAHNVELEDEVGA